MVAPEQILSAIGRVSDQRSFLHELLANPDGLGWPLDSDVEGLDDISYQWSDSELNADGLDRHVVDGQIWQIPNFRTGQPWGVFLLEFKQPDAFVKGRGLTGPLRKVLRGLLPKRRASAQASQQAVWKRENLLFICTHNYRHFRFAYFKAPLEENRVAPLACFGWNQGDTHLRTLCDLNLPPLAFPDDPSDAPQWVDKWASAFDVEKVTKAFFGDYREVFEHTEEKVRGVPPGEPRRLYVQRLFNRLMFAYFIQKKGWLEFDGRSDYLQALFGKAQAGKEDFLNERLFYAFFAGFNTGDTRVPRKERAELEATRGKIPFLNGGLFEMTDEYDARERVTIPNACFGRLLDLFERYNFTVSESTPLDIEVAVDPEILGKVFEELVTGRHETGSYYTPRPVVAFMCREALKGYLLRFDRRSDASGGVAEQQDAVARFVDHGDPSALANPEGVLDALRAVKVCDPACGSGAYLLGMMQELLRLRAALFQSNARLDPRDVYHRKLEIIENCLYGVDIDPFAVNIAMLRLWLSLAVEYEGDTPEPLPNLDFKIGCGDSLTAPDPLVGHGDSVFVHRRNELADGLATLKGQFLKAHDYTAKQRLRQKIEKAEAELTEFTASEHLPPNAFDWRVKFAEVFAPRGGFETTLDGKFGFMAKVKPQLELTQKVALEPGGFDIVLANPPYGLRSDSDYATKVAHHDSYATFLGLAAALSRKGAACSFIIPTSWETGERYMRFRHWFLEHTRLRSLVNLPYDVFAIPFVDTCIATFSPYEPTLDGDAIRVVTLPKRGECDLARVSELLWDLPTQTVRNDPSLRIPLVSDAVGILPLLARHPTLPACVETKRGIEAYQYSVGSARRAGSVPYFEGEVNRFTVLPQQPTGWVHPRPPDWHWHCGRRLVVRRLVSRTNRLMAGLMDFDAVVKKDLYIVRPVQSCSHSEEFLLFILGLLNSAFYSYAYLVRSAAGQKDDFRQVTLAGLRDLPVFEERTLQAAIAECVRGRLRQSGMSSNSAALEQEIDDLVFAGFGVGQAQVRQIWEFLGRKG
jgi:hypothetical protein